MTIGEYCTRDVAIIEPHETILDAAKVMCDQHVGDVVVVERKDEQVFPIGIITDRDIVLELIAKEVDLDSVAAGDLVSSNLISAKISEPLDDVISHMRTHGIRRIPIVNDQGSLEGIFSLDDLIELTAENLNSLVSIAQKGFHKEQERKP